jgi:AraC-like DNA-binding protein
LSNTGTTFLRFSTDEIPEPERNGAIGALYESGMLPSRMVPLADRTPRVDIVRRAAVGLGILSGSLDGVRQEGRPGDSGGPDDDLFLAINVSGNGVATQRGREVILTDGDAVLLTREDTGWAITRPQQSQLIGLKLPRAAISPMVRNLDDTMVKLIHRDSAALKLLTRYLGVVADDVAMANAELRRVVVNQVYDLTALAVTSVHSAQTFKNWDVRAAKLYAIKSDITNHLNDSTLTGAIVADRHGMTLRYLQKLFEAEGISYSEYVLGERLGRAHRMLTNPLHDDRAIGTIAYDVGFNDLSYFNRSFRRRYGATPSDVRHRR